MKGISKKDLKLLSLLLLVSVLGLLVYLFHNRMFQENFENDDITTTIKPKDDEEDSDNDNDDEDNEDEDNEDEDNEDEDNEDEDNDDEDNDERPKTTVKSDDENDNEDSDETPSTTIKSEATDQTVKEEINNIKTVLCDFFSSKTKLYRDLQC